MAHRSTPMPRRAPGRADTLGLALVLAVALGIRLWLAAANSGLTMDSPLYVRMAEDLLAGRRGPSPAHHGYPALVALASLLVPGREVPGRIVSLAASLAIVALVWWVARPRLGATAALVAAALVAVHPLLAVYGGAIMTESAFLSLALAGLALLDRGRHRSGGAWLGAAWWVRPEAAAVAPIAALLAPGRWRERGLALALAACVALPYTLVLRLEQGYWSLTPKTALVRAPFASERAAEWRLSDATAFADTVSLGTRLARDGGAIARAYPAGLEAQAARLLEVWPLPLLILSAVGLFVPGGRGPGSRSSCSRSSTRSPRRPPTRASRSSSSRRWRSPRPRAGAGPTRNKLPFASPLARGSCWAGSGCGSGAWASAPLRSTTGPCPRCGRPGPGSPSTRRRTRW